MSDEASNPDEAFDADFDHRWALTKTPGKWAPLFRRINGVGVVDLIDHTSYEDLPFHRQNILLLLMLVVKERGSELRFEPCQSTDADYHAKPGLELSYIVDGHHYDLVSLPLDAWPLMVQEFGAVTGLSSFRHRLASRLHLLASKIDGQPRPYREGRFRLRAGDETIEVEFIAEPSAFGERIHLILPPVSATLSERVREELKRVCKVREADEQEGSPEPRSTGGGETPGETPGPHSALSAESSSPGESSPVEEVATREEPLVEIDLTRRRSKKSAPLFREIDGISVIDLVGNLDFPLLPPHRQLIFILLIFTVKDRGSALHFEPCSVEYEGRPPSPILKLFYEIEGELRELVPAPWQFWHLMIREFEAMTGLASFRHRLAYRLHHGVSKIDGQPRPRREGRFLLRAGDETITVKLVAWPSDRGERIFLTFDPVSAKLSERARAAMRQLTTLVETETRSYLRRPATDPSRKPSGVLPESQMSNEAPEPGPGADPESSRSGETTL